ncbi:MAG: hypothetical protein ACHQRK_05255 [Gemmatimonadales bacterium]
MIDRLRTSLHTLSALATADLVAPTTERLRGDCADALRLELDCPQQSLTPGQRSALTRLSGLIEDPSPPAEALASAVREAWTVIA